MIQNQIQHPKFVVGHEVVLWLHIENRNFLNLFSISIPSLEYIGISIPFGP